MAGKGGEEGEGGGGGSVIPHPSGSSALRPW